MIGGGFRYNPKITKKDLKDLISGLSRAVPTPITLYTGYWGMVGFDLFLGGYGLPVSYYTISIHDRAGIMVLSLFRKSGMIKAIIHRKTHKVEIRKGTEVLAEGIKFDDFVELLPTLGGTESEKIHD